MKMYRHLFFDLDRTIWDFDRNSLETFRELYSKYKLKEKGISLFDEFFSLYKGINNQLWDQYRKGKVKKEVLRVKRFSDTLKLFAINDPQLAENMADDYVNIGPSKTTLFPNTIETLQKLHGNYSMHIITNGFEEVQTLKLNNSNLMRFFETLTVSEKAGSKKPNKGIFEYALKLANANIEESIMIGDDQEVDIKGARMFGMDTIWINYHNDKNNCRPTWEINSFEKLLEIL